MPLLLRHAAALEMEMPGADEPFASSVEIELPPADGVVDQSVVE